MQEIWDLIVTYLYEQFGARRWVPPWLQHQNQCRYDWAAQHVRAKRVLELGCGSGDGARRLIEAGATSVLALDVSRQAIEMAKKRHQNAALRFDVVEAMPLPVVSGSFDLAIALEVLEHVDDDRGFVAEVARVLTPCGRFLCSTPNRRMTNPGTCITDAPFNLHHVREYEAEELVRLLAAMFDEVELLGQTLYPDSYRSCLGTLGRFCPRLASRVHQAIKVLGMPFDGKERHRAQPLVGRKAAETLLAVCGLPRR